MKENNKNEEWYLDSGDSGALHMLAQHPDIPTYMSKYKIFLALPTPWVMEQQAGPPLSIGIVTGKCCGLT